MYKNKTFLAIIPARGGSKRLPNKNLLKLGNKPLVSWSIEAGLKSKYIDKVIVSSDNNNILNVSKEFGAETIKRPDYLSSDISTTFDTIEHTVNNVKEYDYIVLLQPTSPLRDEKHIDEAIKLLEERDADAIISVCETNHNPQWSNTLQNNLSMNTFISKNIINNRSQDLKTYYRLNGAIYIAKTDKLLQEKTFFLKANSFAYIMSHKSSVDIDTTFDLEFANFLIKNKQGNV